MNLLQSISLNVAKIMTQQIIVFIKKQFVTNATRRATWQKCAGLQALMGIKCSNSLKITTG